MKDSQINGYINVGILEDSPVMREGILQILKRSEDTKIVFFCSTEIELIELLVTNSIDVLLLGLGLPSESGFQVIITIKKKYPEIKILVYSNNTDDFTIQRILKLGCEGYVSKRSTSAQLLAAILCVHGGQSHYPIRFSAFQKIINSIPASLKPVELTKREQELLRLICQDRSTKEIAAELFISVNTVNNHRKNILTKTKQTSLVGLLNFGLLNGYMD